MKNKTLKKWGGLLFFGLVSIIMFIVFLMQFIKENSTVYVLISIISLMSSSMCFYVLIYELLISRKNILKREYLVKKINESKMVFKNEVRYAHKLSFLSSVKKMMNDFNYKSDLRYVTYGRLDFLEKEIHKFLDSNDLEGALSNFYEYVNLPGYFSFNQVPNNSDFKKILKNYDDYYKLGIICEEEKNKILNIVDIIENYINSQYIENGDE